MSPCGSFDYETVGWDGFIGCKGLYRLSLRFWGILAKEELAKNLYLILSSSWAGRTILTIKRTALLHENSTQQESFAYKDRIQTFSDFSELIQHIFAMCQKLSEVQRI